uniref:acid phosphatase n=1 Tax=Heterorhabditis bacteriophora TaxID=37862 RepID=A0A1I7X968_HETBA
MAQHLNLGKRIRKLYVDTGFLRSYYSSREIYIRSSDVNRTIISAMSNMIGMYGQDNNQSFAGRDYPAVDGWPAGLVPIAVHTVDDNTDYIVNPDAKCPRQKQLWSMAKSSDELQNFVKQPYVSELLINLTKYCNETIDIDNLWIVCDSLLIEKFYTTSYVPIFKQIHFNDTLRRSNKWFSDELYKHMVIVNDQVQTYQNGVFGETNNTKIYVV